jgi:hypothetical protein
MKRQAVRKRSIRLAAEKTRIQLLAEFEVAPDWALFDQKTLAAIRNCSEATCERDRWAGTGVPFIRDGRRCLYRKADIKAYYLDRQRPVQSTTQADACVLPA